MRIYGAFFICSWTISVEVILHMVAVYLFTKRYKYNLKIKGMGLQPETLTQTCLGRLSGKFC